MLDFDPRFLGAVSTPGILNITRSQDTVAWSRDNQVALITDGGGVFVVDFVHNHEAIGTETAARLVGNETTIPCSRPNVKDLENYTGISLSTVLSTKEKYEVFEIVRDPLICPKELNNAEVHLYFTKVGWSENALRISGDNNGKYQHILGVLDSHFRLQLFIKRSNDNAGFEKGQVEEEDWDVCVDFTHSYRNLLLSQFWPLNVDDETSFSSTMFSEYKRRMYELATVDFTWLPSWDDSSLENEFSTSFVTAHASGDICIWKLSLDPASTENKPEFFLTLEFRQKLIHDEIVTTMCFHKFSNSFGILAVGTAQGTVGVFQIQHDSMISKSLKPLPTDDGHQPPKYVLDDGLVICERDNIEVQRICCYYQQKSRVGGIFLFKHPNFLLSYELKYRKPNGIVIKDLQNVKRVVQGTLAGVVMLPQKPESNDFVTLAVSQRGSVRQITFKDCQDIEIETSIDLSELEEQGTTEAIPGKLKKRFQFGGLAISPNTAMFCVSKTLAEYYDHLVLRTPSILQFHSLFPSKDAWPLLLQKCISNKYIFHKMTDVLGAFRMLMTSSDEYLKDVLDWAMPLSDKSVNELQILYWALRMQPRVNQDQLVLAYNLRREESTTFLNLKFQSIRTSRRETLVLDRIMQLRCWDFVQKVVANPEQYELTGNILNMQSLMLMYEYLESKKKLLKQKGALPLKPRLLVNPPPRLPACTLCGKSTKIISLQNISRWKKDEDFNVEHPIDEEEIEGVLWHEQEHQQKSRSHPITCCILSLVPASFPYRKCNFCGTVSSKSPSFNQKPICPLCNGLMQPIPGNFNEEETEELGEAELEQLLVQLRGPPKSSSGKKATEPKVPSRKARIEKMYVDA